MVAGAPDLIGCLRSAMGFNTPPSPTGYRVPV